MKLKNCDIHGGPSVIWKNDGGILYCKNCWYKKNPVKVSKKSDKLKTLEISYKLVRKAFLIKNPLCAAKLSNCTIQASDIHHMSGRTGHLLIDTKYFLAVCRNCHIYITEHSKEAIELGLSVSRLSKKENE